MLYRKISTENKDYQMKNYKFYAYNIDCRGEAQFHENSAAD